MEKYFNDIYGYSVKQISTLIVSLYIQDRESYNRIAAIAPKLAIAKSMYDDAVKSGIPNLIDAMKIAYERLVKDVQLLLSK